MKKYITGFMEMASIAFITGSGILSTTVGIKLIKNLLKEI